MNWDAIAAVGQAISALALALMLVQVRFGRSEMARAITQGRLQAARELYMSRASSAELSGLYAKASDRLEEVAPVIKVLMVELGFTKAEAMRLNFDQYAWWTYQQEVIPYVLALPPGERSAFDRSIRGVYRAGSVNRLWYEHSRNTLSSDAVRYVDNLLAQPG